MHKLAAGLLTVIGFLLCFAAAAPARAAFNMERCMANGEARGLRRAVRHLSATAIRKARCTGTPGTATSKGSAHTPQRLPLTAFAGAASA